MTGGAGGGAVELSVVLPVYNEPAVERVVREVVDLVERIAPGAGEVVVVDDASTDGTPAVLAALAAEQPVVRIITQERNQGHGPALVRGFDAARGTWIGHLDTDDQIPTADLGRLWDVRHGNELVLGNRARRHDPRHRLVLTWFVRRLVSTLAGRAVPDANVPCKLFTRSLWAEVRPLLGADTFAPSLPLVIVAARRGRPIRTEVVEHRERVEGETTLRPGRLARAVARSTRQTVRLAVQVRRG